MNYKPLPFLIRNSVELIFSEIIKQAVLNQEAIIDVSGEIKKGMSIK